MTLDAYLAREGAQAERHESCRGEAFAMVGATQAHDPIVANLWSGIWAIGSRARPAACSRAR
jgi:hypothetical protein